MIKTWLKIYVLHQVCRLLGYVGVNSRGFGMTISWHVVGYFMGVVIAMS